MSRSSRVAVSAAIPFALLGLTGCGDDAGGDAAASGGALVTGLYPLQFVADRVAGDDLEVVNLAPPGVEPHDLELEPSKVGAVASATLVLYLGDFAPAVDEAVAQNAADRGLDVADVIDLVPLAEHEGDEHADEHEGDEHADEHADEHDHGSLDPHFWLDPVLLGELATSLADRLAEEDAEHADGYRERADALVAELDELDRAYADGLASCDANLVVTSHSAFGYLAARYGLDQLSVAGLEPDAEPSAARIAEVQHEIEEAGVTTVFFEPLASSAVVDAIAGDLGIDTAELDPVESVDEESGADYLSVMQDNLRALQGGLGCS